ncbi:hypothetical protein AGMMS49983_05340 [Clostridia bacterium]|nr:hypothetical protein AGMMS49983_05340 [Clostridia bacterium]
MRFSKVIAVAVCAALVISAFTACGAATVNNKRIAESQVTKNIETIRENYADKDEWAAALIAAGYTPETLRQTVIDGLISETLIADYAKEQGLQVNQEEIEAKIAAEKARYPEAQEWKEYLRQRGYANDDNFRTHLESEALNRLVSEHLAAQNSGESLSDLLERLRAEARIDVNAMPLLRPYHVKLPPAEAGDVPPEDTVPSADVPPAPEPVEIEEMDPAEDTTPSAQ